MNFVRNAIGLLCVGIASLVLMVAEMVLIWAPSVPLKHRGVLVALVCTALLYLLGAWIARVTPRMRPVGIGLLVTSAITLLDVLTLLAMRLSPEFLSLLAAANHGIAIEVPASGLIRGACLAVLLGWLGWWFAAPGARAAGRELAD
jgi:hypothetical protein